MRQTEARGVTYLSLLPRKTFCLPYAETERTRSNAAEDSNANTPRPNGPHWCHLACRNVRVAFLSRSTSAQTLWPSWSKAPRSGRGIFGCVGSNPTGVSKLFHPCLSFYIFTHTTALLGGCLYVRALRRFRDGGRCAGPLGHETRLERRHASASVTVTVTSLQRRSISAHLY